MTLLELEYFVQVAESGSLSKAALKLGVSQPFLSKHIRQLETELHEYLFRRDGRGIKLTEEGTLFLPYAKAAAGKISEVQEEFKKRKASPIGNITVGAVPDAGSIITPLLNSFSRRFPQAHLEVIEAKSRSIYDYLISGRINIGILFDPPKSAVIDRIPLVEHDVYLISPLIPALVQVDQQIPFTDLRALPLILPSHPHPLRTLIDNVASQNKVPLNIQQQVSGTSFILELVKQGYGCTLLAKHTAKKSKWASRLQINEIVQPRVPRTLTLATLAHAPGSRLEKGTTEMIVELTTTFDTSTGERGTPRLINGRGGNQ